MRKWGRQHLIRPFSAVATTLEKPTYELVLVLVVSRTCDLVIRTRHGHC